MGHRGGSRFDAALGRAEAPGHPQADQRAEPRAGIDPRPLLPFRGGLARQSLGAEDRLGERQGEEGGAGQGEQGGDGDAAQGRPEPGVPAGRRPEPPAGEGAAGRQSGLGVADEEHRREDPGEQGAVSHPWPVREDLLAGQEREGEERHDLADGEQPPDRQRTAIAIGHRRHQREGRPRAELAGGEKHPHQTEQDLQKGAQALSALGAERQRQQRDRAERGGLAVAEQGLAARRMGIQQRHSPSEHLPADLGLPGGELQGDVVEPPDLGLVAEQILGDPGTQADVGVERPEDAVAPQRRQQREQGDADQDDRPAHAELRLEQPVPEEQAGRRADQHPRQQIPLESE